MTITTRDDLLIAFRDAERDAIAFWNAFPLDEFFAPIGEAWSPAENVRHLTKSMRPVAKALTIPRLFLRLRFGRPRRPSVTFEELRTRYRGMLAEGATAGRFSPSAHHETDLAAWRTRIMSEHHAAQEQLTTAIERWPEPQLDRHQLPHPLLGKLTVREMLFFTLYHQSHHIGGVKRRKAAVTG